MRSETNQGGGITECPLEPKPEVIILDPKGKNTEICCSSDGTSFEWKGLVPGDLPGESMLDDYPAKDTVSSQVFMDVMSTLGWNFRHNNSEDLGEEPRVDDIVHLQRGGIVAVITWIFAREYGRIFGNLKGVSGARTAINISKPEAEVIIGMFNDKIRACIEKAAKREALTQALRYYNNHIDTLRSECLKNAGLDNASIRSEKALKDHNNHIRTLRSECLKNARLDDDSIRREIEGLIQDFNMVWDGGYAPSEKAQ